MKISEPIIYFNISWMTAYAGHRDDTISGAHGYLVDHEVGGECYSFLADIDGLFAAFAWAVTRTQN